MTSINPIFEPFIEAHRYKVAKGGRGSVMGNCEAAC